MRQLRYALGALCWICCLAEGAHAQTGSRGLGDQGTWLVGGNAGLAWSPNTADPPAIGVSSLNLWFEPGAGYFIVRNLALGAAFRFTYGELEASEYERTDFAIGMSWYAIYHAALSGELGLLPRLTIGVTRVDREFQPRAGGVFAGAGTGLDYRRFAYLPYRDLFSDGYHVQLDVELFCPLVAIPVAGFFFGVGPYVHWSVSPGGRFFQPPAEDWLLTIGVSTVLGSWL